MLAYDSDVLKQCGGDAISADVAFPGLQKYCLEGQEARIVRSAAGVPRTLHGAANLLCH